MTAVPALVNLLCVSAAGCTSVPSESPKLSSLSSSTSTLFSDPAFPVNAVLNGRSETGRGLAFVLPLPDRGSRPIVKVHGDTQCRTY